MDFLSFVPFLSFFADKGCHMVSVTDLYDRIPAFYTGATTFSFK
jgi:hypothetical protein